MGDIKIFNKSDLIKLCISCPVFKKYWRFNLWSKDCVEYNQLKYCSFYLSKYTFNFTKNFILRHFSRSFLLILYDSPIFIKFIKSGFIKHIDFNFLLFFQENFLMHSRRPNKDIENFVDLYFQRHVRKRFEKDLLCCLVKAVNELVPQSVRRPVILRFQECYLNSVLEGTDSDCLKDLPGIKNLIYKKEFGITEINKKSGIFERLFTIFEKKIYKSFNIYKKSLYIIPLGLPIPSFAVSGKFSYKCINYVNKKNIFYYNCSLINQKYLIHQYSFKLKCFNCLYLLFFKGFQGFYFFWSHSNLDILLKGAFNNKRYKDFDYLFDFALEGLEEFNYRKTKIQAPGHYKSYHTINLKVTSISVKVLKDLPTTLNNHFLKYSNK